MSRRIKRDSNGQFAAGESGNPEGARQRKPKKLHSLSDLYRIQLEVASEVVSTRDGKPVTVFEHMSRSLVTGKSGNRLAAKDFMELTKAAARYLEGEERRQELEKRRNRRPAGQW